jgi:hypothetical protein
MTTGQQLPWSWKLARTNKRDVPWTDKPKYRSFVQLLIKVLFLTLSDGTEFIVPSRRGSQQVFSLHNLLLMDVLDIVQIVECGIDGQLL